MRYADSRPFKMKNMEEVRMQEFSYKKTFSLGEALEILAAENYRVIAGGTDLMLKIKHKTAYPRALLDISSVKELRYVREEGGRISIGACAKLSDLAESLLCKNALPLVFATVNEMASAEIRNMGTVGGNLCCARANCGICFLPGCRAMTADRSEIPCRNAAWSDLLLPLSAYGAEAVLKNKHGERTVMVSNFLKDDGTLDLKPDEIMTEISFACPREGGWGYAKLREPSSMGFPFLVVAVQAENGKFNITIGGSVGHVYQFKQVSEESIPSIVSHKLKFNRCLRLSQGYREKTAASVILEAMGRSLEGCCR
jgi:CO/xanthine dehydrogenase FAD-binding subunit